jgi:hypothetical protein
MALGRQRAALLGAASGALPLVSRAQRGPTAHVTRARAATAPTQGLLWAARRPCFPAPTPPPPRPRTPSQRACTPRACAFSARAAPRRRRASSRPTPLRGAPPRRAPSTCRRSRARRRRPSRSSRRQGSRRRRGRWSCPTGGRPGKRAGTGKRQPFVAGASAARPAGWQLSAPGALVRLTPSIRALDRTPSFQGRRQPAAAAGAAPGAAGGAPRGSAAAAAARAAGARGARRVHRVGGRGAPARVHVGCGPCTLVSPCLTKCIALFDQVHRTVRAPSPPTPSLSPRCGTHLASMRDLFRSTGDGSGGAFVNPHG